MYSLNLTPPPKARTSFKVAQEAVEFPIVQDEDGDDKEVLDFVHLQGFVYAYVYPNSKLGHIFLNFRLSKFILINSILNLS